MEALQALTKLFGVLMAIIILFIVFRQIVLWYFRINEKITLLAGIKEELNILNRRLVLKKQMKSMQIKAPKDTTKIKTQ